MNKHQRLFHATRRLVRNFHALAARIDGFTDNQKFAARALLLKPIGALHASTAAVLDAIRAPHDVC